MATTTKVNSKIVIKIPTIKYFHCFKLSDSLYALFDIKMDMPVVIGSLAIIKSTKVPTNSVVFYYEINESKGYFEKLPTYTIDISGGKIVKLKPPLRYHYVDDKVKIYHVFKLTPILYALWDNTVDMPIVYDSFQRVQATLNIIPKDSTIYYYKEDLIVKNSFKFYMLFKGKVKPINEGKVQHRV